MDSYIYHLFSYRSNYGITPTFVRRDSLPQEGFISIYSVSAATCEAIKQDGTTQGFKGIVWSERLWLDFDSYEAAERAEAKLIEMGVDYVGYDTGGRGAHFGILRHALPSHLLPQRDRQWARDNFPECDKSIYTHLHPFRLPGTTHEKTGIKKSLVCESRGSTLKLPPFKKEELPAHTPSRQEGRNKSIFSCYRVMREMVPAENGSRHAALVRLVYALRDDAQVSKNEALVWCLEWNFLLKEQKDPEEISKVIGSIYDR